MKIVLFDIDGTLVRGDGQGRRALSLAFADVFGVQSATEVAGGVDFNGALDPTIMREIALRLGIDARSFDAAHRDLVASYRLQLEAVLIEEGPPRVLPGVRRLLSRLEAAPGLVTGLLTGNIEAGARSKLRPVDLDRFFPAGAFGEDGPTREEVARVAWHRLERQAGCPVSAGSVWVVGDSVRDIECGRANGMGTLAVATGWTSAAVLRRAGPLALVDDLAATDHVWKILHRRPDECSDPEPCGE
ncbi:MAG: HAD family hydrolase [Acidobacteriota bacterium]